MPRPPPPPPLPPCPIAYNQKERDEIAATSLKFVAVQEELALKIKYAKLSSNRILTPSEMIPNCDFYVCYSEVAPKKLKKQPEKPKKIKKPNRPRLFMKRTSEKAVPVISKNRLNGVVKNRIMLIFILLNI